MPTPEMVKCQLKYAIPLIALALSLSVKVAAISDIKGLNANAPDPAAAEKLMLYGQFVGDWEFDYNSTAPDGSKYAAKGEWNFRWVLEGLAIQDTWILPLRSERIKTGTAADEYGTTLRFYDPKIDAWRVVWNGPLGGTLLTFIARKVSDTIVQEGRTAAGLPMHWVISEITDKSFHWRSLVSRDGEKTWQCREELFARRVGAAPKVEKNTKTTEMTAATMFEVPGLAASGPASANKDKLMLFGQFVGEWDFDYVSYNPDGSKETGKGEWNFGWVLEGRAVQDVWMVPGSAERNKLGSNVGECGTTMRFYDPKLDAWQVVWAGPRHSSMQTFIARRIGPEIILEGKDDDGSVTRWIFSAITKKSFHWRSVNSSDNGKNWKLEQEMFVRRAGQAD
jgi:hypothetical protein